MLRRKVWLEKGERERKRENVKEDERKMCVYRRKMRFKNSAW